MARNGKIKLTGRSSVSLVDAALGGLVGFGAPYAAEHIMLGTDYAASADGAWMQQYAKQLAAGAGIVASVPVYFLRGTAPALIGAAGSVMYGGLPLLVGLFMGEETGNTVESTTTSMGRLRAQQLGRLRALRNASMGQTRQLPVTGASNAIGAASGGGAAGRQLPISGSGSALGARTRGGPMVSIRAYMYGKGA
jgi:hypothetical protein